MSRRSKVTRNFTGATDEIIQCGACKWEIDENPIRAMAVQESYWYQSQLGGYENGRYHSYGLLQIKHDDGSGALVKGGYPDHTTLNVDYFGSEMRGLEDDFYDGGFWPAAPRSRATSAAASATGTRPTGTTRARTTTSRRSRTS